MTAANEIESGVSVARTGPRAESAVDRIDPELANFNSKATPKPTRLVARTPVRGVHDGIPTFFRAACLTASHGGPHGYASAGWHLANSLGTQMPYDLNEDEWAEEISILQTFAAEDERTAIWNWFVAHFPKAMNLVPARRRDRFVKGVRRAWEEERITA